MLGAAIGDIVGSRFELDNYRTTDFELFQEACNFTDDTVCTAAIADWLLHGGDLTVIMRDWCCRYPNLAYGARFRVWLNAKKPMPYNSWGNGSAMRVSAVGWKFDTLPETLDFAKQSAQITHNHAEGIKGAQSVASAIFWARMGKNKAFIRKNIAQLFGYSLERTCDEIRLTYQFNESCQDTVPQAITAFLDSENFEHSIRLAVSLGGDSDTLAAIAGSIAEAFYGIPTDLREQALAILPRDIAEVFLACKHLWSRCTE